MLSEVAKPAFAEGVTSLWSSRRFPQEFLHNHILIARYGEQFITFDDVVHPDVHVQAVELSSELLDIQHSWKYGSGFLEEKISLVFFLW